ncbi:hypothetical protein P9G84_03830 [Brevibacillus centrosporus]|uniref:hypothetical protein n=1 Tax=Brevibacillus centrosporus TaxID=54910 RepID=UPI000F0A505D|nr:hypothetical protein [Brevibacillus centrosporus]MEC2128121.1 hypothetical protein [Brevibacillus centrosporus]RNB63823.1 hypothetical protein EDM55_28360 [Brevibacillus centrosporus]
MKYRKRNPDGTLGDWVETPWSQEQLAPEMLAALEAIVMMQLETEDLKAEISSLKAEIAALKGGE